MHTTGRQRHNVAMPLRTQHINESDLEQFVRLLEGVFGDAPWIAEQAYLLCPFTSSDNLYDCMVHILRRAPEEKRLDVLRRHPGLGACESARGLLAPAAKDEEAGAVLNQCNSDELARIKGLNDDYLARFGFPFIIACTGLGKIQIMAEMDRRLQNPQDEEFEAALDEVEKIAWNRISSLISG